MTVNEANEAIKRNFPDQLKDCMELAEMDEEQLASASGVGRTTILNYLKTGCVPAADKALAMADALGVTVELLLTGKEW